MQFSIFHDWLVVHRKSLPIPTRSGAMSFNFWFLTGGKNAASTIQAIQRATGPADPRPRPSMQLLDREEAVLVDPQQQQFEAPTVQNLGPRRAPAPRPQNLEIMTQRAHSARAESVRKGGSRSPQSVTRSMDKTT